VKALANLIKLRGTAPRKYAKLFYRYRASDDVAVFDKVTTSIAKVARKYQQSGLLVMSWIQFRRFYKRMQFPLKKIKRMWATCRDEEGNKLKSSGKGSNKIIYMEDADTLIKEKGATAERKMQKTRKRRASDTSLKSFSSSHPSEGDTEDEDEEGEEEEDGSEDTEEEESEQDESIPKSTGGDEDEESEEQEAAEEEGEESEEVGEDDNDESEEPIKQKDEKPAKGIRLRCKGGAPTPVKAARVSKEQSPAPSRREDSARTNAQGKPRGEAKDGDADNGLEENLKIVEEAQPWFEESADMWEVQSAMEEVILQRKDRDKVDFMKFHWILIMFLCWSCRACQIVCVATSARRRLAGRATPTINTFNQWTFAGCRFVVAGLDREDD